VNNLLYLGLQTPLNWLHEVFLFLVVILPNGGLILPNGGLISLIFAKWWTKSIFHIY